MRARAYGRTTESGCSALAARWSCLGHRKDWAPSVCVVGLEGGALREGSGGLRRWMLEFIGRAFLLRDERLQ